MSLPSSDNMFGAQKQPTNVFTVLMILSFLFMATSIGLLHYEVFVRYSTKPGTNPPELYDTQPWREVNSPIPQ